MFKRRNQDLRKYRDQEKIPNHAIAEKLGVHENTLMRWLNKELSKEKKQHILSAIEEVKKEMSVY